MLCLLTAHRGQELFTPAQRKIAFGLLALFLLPEIPMVYAHFHGTRLAKAVIDREIRRFGERLNRLTDEQYSCVWALLNSDPEYIYGDEPPMPGAVCGCCECACILPAASPELNWKEGIPNCPCCNSPYMVYGSNEIPVTAESIRLIHNLLFEEK